MRIVRANALQEFKTDPSIDVLVMDGVATVGHDLSTVDTIICMESIPKTETWDQLVSRAYRMGADVRRPITVTTLAYRGSAEEPLLPAHAAQTVISTGLSSSMRSSACNVDDSMYAANDDRKGSTVTEDVEGEDWEEDTAARQAAAVAPDDHEILHLAPPPKRSRSDPTPQTPRQPRQGATGSSSVADGSTVAASVPVPSSRTLSAPINRTPGPSGRFLRSESFVGARPGFEFKLGAQGLGYYRSASTIFQSAHRPSPVTRHESGSGRRDKVFVIKPPTTMVSRLADDFQKARAREPGRMGKTSDKSLHGYAQMLPRVCVVFKKNFPDWDGQNALAILDDARFKAALDATKGCEVGVYGNNSCGPGTPSSALGWFRKVAPEYQSFLVADGTDGSVRLTFGRDGQRYEWVARWRDSPLPPRRLALAADA